MRSFLKFEAFGYLRWLIKNCRNKNDSDRSYDSDGSSSDSDADSGDNIEPDTTSLLLSQMSSDRSNVTRSADSVLSGQDDHVKNVISPRSTKDELRD